MIDHPIHRRIRAGVLGISAIAWLALLSAPAAREYCSLPGTSVFWTTVDPDQLAAMAKRWGLMLTAMMSPMLIAPLYFVYLQSFSQIRAWLMGVCAMGFAMAWAAAGAVLAVGEFALKERFPGGWGPLVVIGTLALIWQASPWKKACLNRCHRQLPLAAFGSAAYRDAFRFGFVHGFWCVGSCWLNMLMPMLLPAGHIVGMMAASALAFCERLERGAIPAWKLRGFRTAYYYLGWIRRARAGATTTSHTPQRVQF